MTAQPLPLPPTPDAEQVPERTKTRLLELLKRHGPQTAQALAARLQITTPAARRHLSDLQVQTLVQSQIEKPGGRGRPQHVFRLTDHGDERAFPKTYSALCLDLLQEVSQLYGPDAPTRVLQARSDRLGAWLSSELPPSWSLPARLARLAELLSELGFDASVEEREGAWYLVQRNCPTLQVARAHKSLCASEINMYVELLGMAVEREEHIACGQSCCRYRMTPLG